jgi:hypothetical protein
MKLEELRQRLREPKRRKPVPKLRKRRKRAAASPPQPPMHQNCRSSATPLTASKNPRDWLTKTLVALCDKCGKSFTPDLKVGYVPSTCAKCASYL